MKLVATCLLLEVFAFIETTKPRTVNLNLETVLEFENKDNSADIQIIDKIQTFLDKVKNVIHRKKTARRSIDDRDYKFTDFIENVIITLKSFEDEDLEDAIAVLDDEIRKYHYKGCKFHELIENKELRRFVALKLDQVRDEPAESIKRNIQTILNVIDKDNIDKNVKEIIDYINSLYRQESEDKFKRFLNNLQLYRSKSKRANLDLIKVVRDGIRTIVFDHYTNLNVNARRDLKFKLETFWKNYLSPKKADYRVWNVEYTKSSKNLDVNYNIYENKQSNHEYGNKSNPMESKIDSAKQYDDIENNSGLSKDKMRQDNGQQDKDFPKENVLFESNKFIPVNINDFPKIIKNKSAHKGRTYKSTDNNSKTNRSTNHSIAKKYVADIENENTQTTKKHEAKTKYRFDIKNHHNSNKKISMDTNNHLKNSYDDTDKDLTSTKQDDLDQSKHKDTNSDDEENDESIQPQEYSPYDSKESKENILSKIKRYSSSTIRDTFKTKKGNKHRQLAVTLYPEAITAKTKRKTSKTRSYKLQTLWHEEVKHEQYKANEQKDKRTTNNNVKRTEYPISEESFEKQEKNAKSKRGRHRRPSKQKQMLEMESSGAKKFDMKGTENSRKFLQARTTLSSDEGISIESFESGNEERLFRKNNDKDNLIQNGTVPQESNVTTIRSSLETNLNTTRNELVTEFEDDKVNEVADYGPLDFWEGTTKITTLKTTTKPTTKITDFSTITKPLRLISVHLNTSTKMDEKDNVTAETRSVASSTNTPGFSLRSSDDVKQNIINLKNQVNVAKETLNLTDVKEETAVTEAPPTVKIKPTAKASVKSKTVKVTKQKAKIKISVTPSKQTSKYNTINVIREEKSSTTSGKAETVDVFHFLNQSETLNTEDERKKKLMHEKFMKDMSAIFAPTTEATVTYNIPKEATDPFNDIEDELNIH